MGVGRSGGGRFSAALRKESERFSEVMCVV
jgi:hypothetical protein